MDIKRSGANPSGRGPAEYFTGAVRVDPLHDAHAPARVSTAAVTFEPGARTAWHTHPLGQTLVVTAGCGRAQRWGGPIEELRPGDVVWIPPPLWRSSMACRPTGWRRSAMSSTWVARLEVAPSRRALRS